MYIVNCSHILHRTTVSLSSKKSVLTSIVFRDYGTNSMHPQVSRHLRVNRHISQSRSVHFYFTKVLCSWNTNYLTKIPLLEILGHLELMRYQGKKRTKIVGTRNQISNRKVLKMISFSVISIILQMQFDFYHNIIIYSIDS